jgi:hypothetical protein
MMAPEFLNAVSAGSAVEVTMASSYGAPLVLRAARSVEITNYVQLLNGLAP